jgi:ABC-type branched-subunit amino acid transport system ATPase component
VRLTVKDVHVHYGGRVALDGVSLEAPAGAITGVVGSNGAGKSTLLGAIGGQVKPRSGHVEIGGVPLDGLSPARRARRGLGRSFQRASVFFGLTVREDVGLGASDDAAVAAALGLFGLCELADRPTETLPLGARRRVELARCRAATHRFLQLDEPACNLDEGVRASLAEALRRLRAHGVGLVIVDHDLALIDAVCDEVVKLEHGVVVVP